ncbi:MAG: hypothetical protein AB1499_15670 [Nitrospirota bacterium]
MGPLLAIDLGIRTGLALYGPEGKLRWYRSKNFGTASALRRGANTLLNSLPDLSLLVIEGSGPLATIWEREAERRKIIFRQISAEQWRHALLYPREQHSGLQAKHYADDLARKIIKWSGITRPSSLRHDTAEAVLIGFWALLEAGWLKELPHELRR